VQVRRFIKLTSRAEKKKNSVTVIHLEAEGYNLQNGFREEQRSESDVHVLGDFVEFVV
jgi:hypothetical protein